MNINKQIAIVTGGTSGLGRACVEHLYEKGAQVIIWDKNLEQAPEFAVKVLCDVSESESVDNAYRKTIEDIGIGVPRILINCAGIAAAKKIIDKDGIMPFESFQNVININLIGTFNALRVVSAGMAKLKPLDNDEQRGVIINTASIAAYEGQVGQSAYSASKGGIVGLTLPAARELAQYGIRVNSIAPGIFATPLLLKMPQNIQDSLASNIPFPKRLGYPDEFASMAGHIIENNMLNGEVIRLDGGLRMQSGIKS